MEETKERRRIVLGWFRIAIDLLMKERIGFGTVIDALKAQATQIRYKPGFVIYLHFSNEEQT